MFGISYRRSKGSLGEDIIIFMANLRYGSLCSALGRSSRFFWDGGRGKTQGEANGGIQSNPGTKGEGRKMT